MNFAQIPPIPFSRPYLSEKEAQAVTQVLESGWIVGGPQLEALEARFCRRTKTKHAIGVSSWTMGAFLTLHAWGIGPRDEVIVPSFSFIATANVVRHVGATPVFCDLDPNDYNMDPQRASDLITNRTRAIIPVDQLGMPCRMDDFSELAKQHGLHLFQDSACAIGSMHEKDRPVGSLAEAAGFSLHARKVVTCGEGGMIVTNDTDLAKRLRRLRHQGMNLTDRQRHLARQPLIESYPEVGYNGRLTDIQAAIAVVQMDKLDEMLLYRQQIANRYNKKLQQHKHVHIPRERPGCRSNWQSYMVILDEHCPITPKEIMIGMQKRNIPLRRGCMAAHLEPCYKKTTAVPSLPITEIAATQGLQLPIYPDMRKADADRVADALLDILYSAA